MDELADLHMDTKQRYVFTTIEAEGEGWDTVKLP